MNDIYEALRKFEKRQTQVFSLNVNVSRFKIATSAVWGLSCNVLIFWVKKYETMFSKIN